MNKGKKIMRELGKLNMVARGHEVRDYSEDGEIAVKGINVPMLADCKDIAKRCGVSLKVEELFDMVIFRWW